MPEITGLYLGKLKKDIIILATRFKAVRRNSQGETLATDETAQCWELYEKLRIELCAVWPSMFSELCQLPTPKAVESVAWQDKTVFGATDVSTLSNEIARLEHYFEVVEREQAKESDKPDSLNELHLIARRFHQVVRQLRTRHAQRATLEVEDEYDVQNLLHVLLQLYFEDIRPEEWTPSYAGKCSRMDFLLKTEQIVIETKKTRQGLDAKELGSQLIEDIQRYQAHPDCKTLFCFVYDPEARIANPRGLENDLSKQHGDLQVVVRIEPQ